MSINKDYNDLFKIFKAYKVKYLVIGAYAVIFYTEPRYTKDIDILVEPSKENAERVYKALSQFGAPLKNISVQDFCNPNLVYQIGIEPNRIDIIMGIPGLVFSKIWQNRIKIKYGKTQISIININDLIKSKKKTNRFQDKIDIKKLEHARKLFKN